MAVARFGGKGRLAFGALLLLSAAAFWFTLPRHAAALAPGPASALAGNPYPVMVAGAYHVHTTRSDGSGTIDDVAAAAARAGLKFVIVTDHGDGRRAPLAPSYRSGVLCLDAVEISTTGGHYVALGLPQTPYRLAGEPRDVVGDVARLGGFGIAAHPDSPKRELAWADWTLPIGGVEWLNIDTEWRDESRTRILLGLAQHLVRPVATVGSLIGHPATVLERWDRMTPRRRVTALAAVDAHARFGVENAFDASDSAMLEVPSYETSFRTVQIDVLLAQPLTGRADADAAAVLASMRGGRVLSRLTALAPRGRVELVARASDRVGGPGDFLPPGDPLEVSAQADAPAGARLRLMCDGRVAREAPATTVLSQTWRGGAPGTCRLEVGWDEDGRFARWVVTNPIYFRSADPPPPEPASVTLREVDTFGDPVNGATWVTEHDPASRADLVHEGAGLDQRITMSYTLGAGARAGQYVAAVTPDVEALASRTHVAFVVRADRPMRVSVQGRAPVAGDGQRWRRSIYVDETPRDVTLALDDLRPVPPLTTPHPAPGALRSLLFVIDTENTPTGASGTIWIERLRAGKG
jgi:hypothetical protein